MIVHGPVALSDFFGDLVIYRNLDPVDPRLPGLAQLAPTLGLEDGRIPRKTETDYARVVARILEAAATLEGKRRPLSRLLFLGDTQMNDVSAFRNLCQVAGWPGLAFICTEKPADAAAIVEAEPGVFVANRWALLGELGTLARARSFAIDDDTVAVVDIDKTAIGARGRNDRTIDEARIEGVRRTAAALLGASYDEERFLVAYHRLNRPPFHPFTADNQDYLVYVCLAIAAGLAGLDEIVAAVEGGRLRSFAQFIEDVQGRRFRFADSPLAAVHDAVYERFRAGDPTPFKAFRRSEFRATVELMGCLPGEPTADEALAREIVVTHEVAELAWCWRLQGALVFGASDKPDEAALPDPEGAEPELPPIHRAPTHCVGEKIG